MMVNIRFPEVQTCCYCVSLRTGSKLFGFMSLVGSLTLSLSTVGDFAFITKHPEYFKGTLIYLSVDLLAQLIHMGTSFVLLLGVYQEKPKLMPWWLVSTVAMALLEVFLLPSFFWQSGFQYLIGHAMTETILYYFMILDDIYGFLVVYSYYRTLSPQNEGVV